MLLEIFVVFGIIYNMLYAHHYLYWIERRTGCITLNDPVLPYIPRVDFCNEVSLLQLLLGIYTALHLTSQECMSFFIKLTLINVCKMVMLYVTPLDPPEDIIPLKDFVLTRFIFPADTAPPNKDLVFSGHTAFVFLCLLSGPAGFARYCVYIPSLLVMMFMLLAMRVHYTIDVLIAPFVVYTVSSVIS